MSRRVTRPAQERRPHTPDSYKHYQRFDKYYKEPMCELTMGCVGMNCEHVCNGLTGVSCMSVSLSCMSASGVGVSCVYVSCMSVRCVSE